MSMTHGRDALGELAEAIIEYPLELFSNAAREHRRRSTCRDADFDGPRLQDGVQNDVTEIGIIHCPQEKSMLLCPSMKS